MDNYNNLSKEELIALITKQNKLLDDTNKELRDTNKVSEMLDNDRFGIFSNIIFNFDFLAILFPSNLTSFIFLLNQDPIFLLNIV